MARVLETPPGLPLREFAARLNRPAVLAAALAIAGVLVVHAETTASIVAIWLRSETLAHGFVVPLLCLWLAWRERDALARRRAAPWYPAVAAVLLFGAAWLVATLANVQVVRQFALVLMLEAAIVAVVGLDVAR